MTHVFIFFAIVVILFSLMAVYFYKRTQHPLSEMVRKKVIFITMLIIFTVSSVSYFFWGNLQGWHHASTLEKEGLLLTQIHSGEVKDRLSQLQKRISLDPKDKLAWQSLIQQLSAMGQYQLVLKAIERYDSIHDTEDFVNLKVQSLYLVQGSITPDVEQLFEKLKERPQDHYLVNMIEGIESYKKNNKTKAKEHWQLALQEIPANHPDIEVIEKAIEEADLKHQVAKEPKVLLNVKVDVADNIEKDLKGSWYLWVIAKKQGERAPLAVFREVYQGQLPKQVVLTDQMAMLKDHQLEKGQTIEVTARLSRSNQAVIAKGDLWGREGIAVLGGNQKVAVVIDTLEE